MTRTLFFFAAVTGIALFAGQTATNAQPVDQSVALSEVERAWVECLQTNARQLDDAKSDPETVGRKVVERCEKPFSDVIRAGCIPLQPAACEAYTRMLTAGHLGVATQAVSVARNQQKPAH